VEVERAEVVTGKEIRQTRRAEMQGSRSPEHPKPGHPVGIAAVVLLRVRTATPTPERHGAEEKLTYNPYEVAGLLHINQVRVGYLCRLHRMDSRKRFFEADVTQLRERLKEGRKVK
jgi:hypothetical protein